MLPFITPFDMCIITGNDLREITCNVCICEELYAYKGAKTFFYISIKRHVI